MTSAKFNYTKRRKIKSDLVDLRIVERTQTYIRVRVRLDSAALKASDDCRIVLDGFSRGNHQRKTIEKPSGENHDFTDFPVDANLRFKVRLISVGESEGKVLAATADIRPKEADGKTKREPFIVPTLQDIGSLPWRIDWDGDHSNPRIVLNRKLEQHFGNWRHPVLQALYLPAMLRELLTGIICRMTAPDDLDDETLGGRVFAFCFDKLELDQPAGSFHDDNGVSEDWLAWAEECVEHFSEKKWRHEKTLLEQMLEMPS